MVLLFNEVTVSIFDVINYLNPHNNYVFITTILILFVIFNSALRRLVAIMMLYLCFQGRISVFKPVFQGCMVVWHQGCLAAILIFGLRRFVTFEFGALSLAAILIFGLRRFVTFEFGALSLAAILIFGLHRFVTFEFGALSLAAILIFGLRRFVTFEFGARCIATQCCLPIGCP